MKNLKNIKVGDVIDMSKRDITFVTSCFKRSNYLKNAATTLFADSQEEAKAAWEGIYIKWPELTKFHLEVDAKEKCIIVKNEK